MVKPIGDTPLLYGKEASDFLNKMNEEPTKEQKELSKKIKSQRIALF